eukprot:528651-Prorocentrum_minimum.AAC.1
MRWLTKPRVSPSRDSAWGDPQTTRRARDPGKLLLGTPCIVNPPYRHISGLYPIACFSRVSSHIPCIVNPPYRHISGL